MKLKFLSTVAFAITLIYSSCGNGAGETTSNKDSITTQKNKSEINLTSISSIPDSLSGCSCTFSESKSKFDADSFLYFDDMGTVCLISVDNKLILLKPVKAPKDVLNAMDVVEFSNGEYTAIIINKKKIGSGEESSIITGELIVKRKDGASISIKVYGICGC